MKWATVMYASPRPSVMGSSTVDRVVDSVARSYNTPSFRNASISACE
jgi:hypothetical protein